MKTLDQIIQDFEQKDVEGDGTKFSPSGTPVSDFDTSYMPKLQTDPAAFSQNEFNGTSYDVQFDDTYQPVDFSTTWMRMHNMTKNISDPSTKDFLIGLLASDPRWVFYNYKNNIQKLNNNLYTVKIDSKQVLGATISRTVEFYVNDKDVLEKIRMVQSTTQYNVSKDLYSQEVEFVYPYDYDQDDDDDTNQGAGGVDDDDDKDVNDNDDTGVDTSPPFGF